MNDIETPLMNAEYMLNLLLDYGLTSAIADTHRKAWGQGALYVQSSNPYTRALGCTILLSAALDTPDVARLLLANVRDAVQGIYDLVEADDAA